MAYTQDISLLMRELLKVPKDYTPTAVEISKYIKSRYVPDKDISGNRLIGTRKFSSVPAQRVDMAIINNNSALNNVLPKKNPTTDHVRSLGRFVNNKRMATRRFSGAVGILTNRAKMAKEPSKTSRKKSTLAKQMTSKRVLQKSSSKRTYSQTQSRAVRNEYQRPPRTAPTEYAARNEVKPSESVSSNKGSWNWQKTKKQFRRAISEIGLAAPKSKLETLSEQQKIDQESEIGQQNQKKEILRQMVSEQGAITEDRVTPIRTREILQLLMEENKLEIQKREIARLREMAKKKIMEARKAIHNDSRTRRTNEPFEIGS